MARDLFIGVTEQSKASIHRWDDAHALLNAARWRGAMYLAGYSIECLLKAKLTRMFDCDNLLVLDDELQRRNLLAERATIFTHQLEVLLRLTKRSGAFAPKRDIVAIVQYRQPLDPSVAIQF